MKRTIILTLIVLAFFATSCSSKTINNQPQTYEVSGTVIDLHWGVLLGDITVFFQEGHSVRVDWGDAEILNWGMINKYCTFVIGSRSKAKAVINCKNI